MQEGIICITINCTVNVSSNTSKKKGDCCADHSLKCTSPQKTHIKAGKKLNEANPANIFSNGKIKP